jgi:hypothetical protein
MEVEGGSREPMKLSGMFFGRRGCRRSLVFVGLRKKRAVRISM